MSKEEVYYEIVFTNYSSLSGTPGSSWPTNSNHTGEVRALCEMFPERVITYDQLATDHPIQMYSNLWSDSDRNTIKSYIDQYKTIPKYFDLRNYFDADIYQSGGQSLMVSDSPELETTYIKFKSGTKTIYCSLMTSSGDFFYSYNLPEEILEKSGLRDEIVRRKFHPNWYFTAAERDYFNYIEDGTLKYYFRATEVGHEKYVFNKLYFKPNFPYGIKNLVLYYDHYRDGNGNIYQYNQVQYKFVDDDNQVVIQVYPYFTLEKDGTFYVRDTSTEVTRYRYKKSDVHSGYNGDNSRYYVIESGVQLEVSPGQRAEKYSDIQEDLKRDFIDLEVTRRILYDYDYHKLDSQYHIVRGSDGVGVVVENTNTDNYIPKISVGTVGYNTNILYDRPQEYISKSPMPIQYDRLRETLNDRDPYSDCETVLVMWVANGDPDTVPAGDIHGLRDLNWEQYAIPVSIRCCFKDTIKNGKHSTKRFLVHYPRVYDPSSSSASEDGYVYRFHTRRNRKYTTAFKEDVYLQSLMEYSRDYILTYQNVSYTDANYSSIFDIQKHLFTNNLTDEAFYIRKQFCTNTNTQQNQCHYLLVDQSLYDIDVNNSICLVENGTHTTFTSRSHFTYENCTWGTIEPAWSASFLNNQGQTRYRYSINNDRFIVLFNPNNSLISQVTGKLELYDSSTLKTLLETLVPGEVGNWDDLYLSSLGISNMFNWGTADAILHGIGSISEVCVPLGFLDGHIRIGGTNYGRNTNNGVIVGFKDVFEYAHDDVHHFHYNTSTSKYELVVDSNRLYTAYVMQYPS